MKSYAQVHSQLQAERGAARGHTCIGCGSPAQHWAYLYNGDPEIPRTSKRGPYSEDTRACYAPMCVSCHRKHDFENDEWLRSAYRDRSPQTPESRKAQGEHMGRVHADRLKNDAEYAERHRAYSRKNALKRRRCTECGLVSHPPGVARHQKTSGHQGHEDLL